MKNKNVFIAIVVAVGAIIVYKKFIEPAKNAESLTTDPANGGQKMSNCSGCGQ